MKNNLFRKIGKILSFPVLKIFIGVALINIGAFIMRNLAELFLFSIKINNDLIISTFVFIIRILTLFFIYKFFIWIYEKRKPEEIDLNKSSLIHFFFGSILGIVMIGIVFLFNWIFGWITIKDILPNYNIFNGIYSNFFFALLQDIVYYLIIYKISEEYIGTYLSAIITGLIFGLKHLLFPEYTIYSGIMVFLCAVILFPALFLKSRNVWIIFGFHFFWNYIQNSILGISKPEGLTSFLDLKINGPIIFTGDASGFEPSIITCFIAILVGLYFLNNVKSEGKIVKPIWMKN